MGAQCGSALTSTSGGLTILPEVPDLPAVLIEGRNGIGKTVLVHLLELISGKQPFAEHRKSWLSLRERLGNTAITLSGLNDGHQLVVKFTPHQWPTDEVPLTIGDWLGEVSVDGQIVRVADAQRLLWVERFAGNEDVGRTLRRRLDIYADRVGRTQHQISSTINRINEALQPLVEQLRPLDPQRLVAHQHELAEAETREVEAEAELETAIARHERVLAAIEHSRRVDAANDPSAELAARRSELQRELTGATEEHDEVQERVRQISERLTRDGDAQAALADPQRIQRHRAKRLRNLENDVARAARNLQIEPGRDEVLGARDVARSQLEELRRQRALLDAGGQTSRLIDRVDGLLVSAAAEGLDDQEFAIMRDERFSVGEVQAGMRMRAEELRGRPLPEELQTLDRAIAEAQRHAAWLNTLANTLSDLDRRQELLTQADEEVRLALERAENAGARDEAFSRGQPAIGSTRGADRSVRP